MRKISRFQYKIVTGLVPQARFSRERRVDAPPLALPPPLSIVRRHSPLRRRCQSCAATRPSAAVVNRAPPLAPPLCHSHLRVSFSHVQPLLSIFNLAQRRVNAAVCLQVPHSAALAVAALQNARRRCVTCIVTDHPSNGVLISRIVGLADRLRNLKLSKASLYFIFLFCEYFQLTAQQDPEVSCEARCAEDLIARLSDGQMKADGALLLSNLS